MIHVLVQLYDDWALVACGRKIRLLADGLPQDNVNEDFVGAGRGKLVDGEGATASWQAALVNCPGCDRMFPLFNDGAVLHPN